MLMLLVVIFMLSFIVLVLPGVMVIDLHVLLQVMSPGASDHGIAGHDNVGST